jgi:hypothetical protein
MDFTWLSKLDYSNYVGWVVLCLYLYEKVLSPLANRILPMQTKLLESQQQRLDSDQRHRQDMEARQVRANEDTAKATADIGRVLAILETRMTSMDFTQRETSNDIKEIKQAVVPRKAKKV